MKKTVSIILLIVAALLLVLGIEADQSTASAISRAMTGAPSDSVVWLTIAGLLAGITAIFGFSDKVDKQF